MPRKEKTLAWQPLRAYCAQLFQAVGMPADQADLLSDTLVEADLRGVHSHGVIRVPDYLKSLQEGRHNPQPNIKIVMDTATLTLIDGDNGLGQVPSVRAMELAIHKAKASGIAASGVRNSGHNGAAGYYAMMALEKDMIGFATTGGVPCIAPWGGLGLVVGNNPIAWAIPAGEERPVVLDMATSIKAQGWIMLAGLAGRKIPLGWAYDKHGKLTTDPQEAMESNRVEPIGGYKGYGLSVVMDVLTSVLTGADSGIRMNAKRDRGQPWNYGHFFMAIDIAPFIWLSEFKAHMDEMIRGTKATPRAEGVERIYLPGEIEFENKERHLKGGIPLVRAVVQELISCGKELGVPAPFTL